MAPDPAHSTVMHASCVALSERAGVLITGPSGSGKSSLALGLMALGARLVSDDQTSIAHAPDADTLIATAPPSISNMIEARGIGLLAADALPRTILKGVVDLSQVETERLPPLRETSVLGLNLPVIYRTEGPAFVPALFQWLKGGRRA